MFPEIKIVGTKGQILVKDIRSGDVIYGIGTDFVVREVKIK